MVEYLIDYFRITIHESTHECINLYQNHFELALGKLVSLHHGAKGYKGVMESAFGFQLKHTPGFDREYCTFEFPGDACKAIPPEFFIYFFRRINRLDIEFNVNRIDIAFDNVPFTPHQFKLAIEEDLANEEKKIIRSLTKRDSMKWISRPFKSREDGSGIGQDTCYFGSRMSERYLRVYNKRGPTRLELELKGERASIVAKDLLMVDEKEWFTLMVGHLLDFIDIDKSWWKKFIGNEKRAYVKLHSAKEKSLEKTCDWLFTQVSPALSAVTECTDGQILYELLEEGYKRMQKNYSNLLSLNGK